ncbi:NADH:flavin oxidoreductase [Tsukamurella sp. 1534]|uniref:NADH:flavin oxidoreductase n=1 Tax=Tsukamurella sp. 1534 TaxID=1151061 RepID=UPI000305EA82|nr:NADH:flavin oxidoreductase [Tsukamurella sp. 1534]
MTDPYAPADLGPLRLRNRTIKAATFEGRTPDALVTDDLIDFHAEFARGGVGMTTVAYCAVAPEGRTERRQLWMRPEAVPGLLRLTAAVHAEGAAVSAQLGHAGPVADGAEHRTPVTPSRMVSPLALRRTARPDAAHVRRLVAAHAEAAVLAADAGFDAVELHFGHNYLISAFLSPLLNRRRDGYGGSLPARARLAREVAIAVREAVGDRIAVTAKLNMTDGVPGGLRPDDALRVTRWLESDGALDALELTAGSSLLNPMYLFHGTPPRSEFAAAFPSPALRAGLRVAGPAFLRAYPYRPAYLLDLARRFRAALSMPLVLLGGVSDGATVQRAMDEGFEFVALGRGLLRTPDLVRRMAADPHEEDRCTHCNLCMPTIYRRTECPVRTAEEAGA